MTDVYYTIEKNIPIPARRQVGGRLVTSPLSIAFAQMQVGDSIYVPAETGQEKRIGNLISAVTAAKKKRHGRTFCRRSEAGGYRVWRLS